MSFREAFRDYSDYYTVIGGTACMILMEEASRDFRATKDVDMILIMEDGGKEFCKTFWEYILFLFILMKMYQACQQLLWTKISMHL